MTDNARPDHRDGELRILATQNHVLGLVARRHTFEDTLAQLCLLIEEQSPGATCSILLVDRDYRHLRVGAGPNVPEEYLRALDGLPIADDVGSCGAAAFRGEPVICPDVEHDPRWTAFRPLAARFGVKSCWSTPFFSSTDNVLGTFAISHGDSRAPDSFATQLLQTAGYLAGIATENHYRMDEAIQRQKLESVAVLAGGIAHDFNNLLTAIMGNIELARAAIRPGDPADHLLVGATRASVRARDITQQLLTFAVGGGPVTEAASIREVVTETVEFTLAGSNVRCDATYADDLRPVEIDRGQVSQVIQNILVNAVQAMPTGGVVRIAATLVRGVHYERAPGTTDACVCVSIADTGPGIPGGQVSRIFDPFFSTKATGRGLGLATSYSIMRRHDGWIDVESSPGHGTTFFLYFPVAEGQRVPSAPAVVSSRPVTAAVLIMDDHDAVREMLQRMLVTFGCEVVAVADGLPAVDAFGKAQRLGRPFDLTILDLTVPGGMGGADTLAELKRLDPSVRAVATSGYSNSPILSDPLAHGFVGRLAKPYLVGELRTLLQELLPVDDTSATGTSGTPRSGGT